MNCRPGDLAIVVRSSRAPVRLGTIVRVLRPALSGEAFVSTCGGIARFVDERPSWVVESARPQPWWTDLSGRTRLFKQRVFWDANLRPIRPNEGDDETLSWAGKPEQVPA